MKFDLSDKNFSQQAASWLSSLGDSDIVRWSYVIRTSPGYYPSTLLPMWRRELERRGLAEIYELQENASPSVPYSHPADYDWRFTQATAVALTELVLNEVDDGSLVAHVGTPSTFIEGIRAAPQRQHVLLERNPAMVGALTETGHQIIEIDLFSEDPSALEAQGVITDPPWYFDDTRAFLRAASLISDRDAVVYLCQPTLATRPGVDEERLKLVDELPLYGFELLSIYKNTIRYEMPHFEAMSLRSSLGTLTVPNDWRTGDILKLRRSGHLTVEASRVLVAPEEWQEVKFGNVRIKLRASGGPDLGHIVSGDILSTVSRRDPMRDRIGFWTSGNRILSLQNPTKVGSLIKICHTDYMNTRFSLDRTIRGAQGLGMTASLARRLFDVLLAELQEHDAYLRGSGG